MAKATIIFYPNVKKKEKRTGKIPVYLRIIFKGKKAEARLNIQLTQKEFSCWDSTIMRVGLRESKPNKGLNIIEAEFDNFISQNAIKLLDFGSSDIRDSILGKSKNTSSISLSEYMHNYYKAEILLNDFAEGTKKNYRKAIRHMAKFLKLTGKQELFLIDIDNSFANDFKKYLLSSKPDEGRVGMTEPSALGIIKKFRTIFHFAIKGGLISLNPFCTVKFKKKSPRKPKLNIQQVKEIMNPTNSWSESLEVCKDIFMFSVLTGLAYTDCFSLKKSSLSYRTDGNVKLTIDRIKSEVLTELFLVSQAKEIILKYENNPEIIAKGKVLPQRSNKTLNAHLKIIAEKLEIPIKLTSHIGRHTNRQLLFDADVNDHAVVKRMFGHSTEGEMDKLYYEITEKRLIEAKQKFQLFLDTNL